jgi:xylulokinase
MADVLLGVDIGTSSSKGVVAHPDGSVVATVERPHDTDFPQPGFVEHDPEGVWWGDFTAIVAELLERSEGHKVVGVSVSGIGACTLPADADGNPLRSSILYGIDTRAGREIDELNERFSEDAILERGHAILSHQSVGPKLAWIRRNQPEIWGQTKQLLMPNSFIVQRLTGEYTLDSISAAFCTPLYDAKAKTWIQEWADEVVPGLTLPPILDPWATAGTVTAKGAELTGLPEGIPVCAGTIDAYAESASVGVKEPGDIMLMYGTTLAIIGVLTEPVPSADLWSTPGVFPGTHAMLGAAATSGALTKWVRGHLSDGWSFEQLIEQATATPPGASGLVVLPYFAGERTPLYDANARGVIAGLTLSHTRGHLYRAMLEATAYSACSMLTAFHDAGVESNRVVAIGGGTKGGLWTQIVSDVTGLTQELSNERIGASYGDALFAGRAAGLVGDYDDWEEVADTVKPNPANREVYDRLYEVYQQLYPATKEQVHTLAALQLEEGVTPEG